jgi:hypothetical protein
MEQAMSTDALREAAIEELAEKLHAIYQQEAERQGDKRHHDSYAVLPERIKEFDRVLARYILQRELASETVCVCCHGTDEAAHKKVTHHCLFCERERAASETEKLPAKWRTMVPKSFYAIDVARDCANELEAALKADRQGGRNG